MRLCWMYYNHMEMCILSGICVCMKNKIVEMRVFGLKRFSAKLRQMYCIQLLPNRLQDCYETNWGVILSYGDGHIVGKLCWDKNFRNDSCWNFSIFQQNLVWCVVYNSSLTTRKIIMKLNCVRSHRPSGDVHTVRNKLYSFIEWSTKVVLIAVWSWLF